MKHLEYVGMLEYFVVAFFHILPRSTKSRPGARGKYCSFPTSYIVLSQIHQVLATGPSQKKFCGKHNFVCQEAYRCEWGSSHERPWGTPFLKPNLWNRSNTFHPSVAIKKPAWTRWNQHGPRWHRFGRCTGPHKGPSSSNQEPPGRNAGC